MTMTILMNALLTALLSGRASAAPAAIDFDGKSGSVRVIRLTPAPASERAGNKGIPPPSDPDCYGNCPDDDPPSDDTPPPPPPPSQPQQPPSQPQQPPSQPQQPPIPVTPPHTNPPPPSQPYYPPPPPPPGQQQDFNFYYNKIFPLFVCAWEANASDKKCTQQMGDQASLMFSRSVAKDMLMDEGVRRFSLRYKYPMTYYEAAKTALGLLQHSVDAAGLMLSEEVGENRNDPHFEWMSPEKYALNLRLMMENEKLIREWKEAARKETATSAWRDAGDSTLEYQCGPACEKLKRELLGKDVFEIGRRRSPFGAAR